MTDPVQTAVTLADAVQMLDNVRFWLICILIAVILK